MSYYAVVIGRSTGIFTSWANCEAQVKDFPGAIYRKFNSADQAQTFIEIASDSSYRPLRKSAKIYTYGSNGLKRPHATSSSFQYRASDQCEKDSKSSDDGDDLSTILNKQMDDIEKRLHSFEKGLNKFLKNNTSCGQDILIEPPQKRNRTYSCLEFDTDDDGFTIVYTDGACSSNGHQGVSAGYGVYWGDGHPLNTFGPVSSRATNNCGEIQAATHAIEQAIQNGIKKLVINTDSQFLINSVTKWMPVWKHKGWKLRSGKPVKNEIDFKELDKVLNQVDVKWNYVKAHHGIHGNVMANRLARQGAALYQQTLKNN